MRSSILNIVLATLTTSIMGVTHVQAANYHIDPTHTFATFEIDHFGASVNRVRFDKKEGSISFDRTAKTGQAEISIDVKSVNSGTAAFDKHLQNEDLFNVAKYPTIKFKSDKFIFNKENNISEVTGHLTLLDKTHPVTFKANQFTCYENPMLKREVCGGDFTTTIDRTLWGMNYAIAYGSPKMVRLVIQIEAIKE